MFCRNCGKQIEEDSLFCKYCGKIVSSENSLSQNKGIFGAGVIFRG
ncbi:MAG: zinc-ribbon domain-containing protein [Bacteroidaceae bacterium]|nr:zinc-ribbon domain-containing protein [Bacteroidaceae bacterium]